MRRQAENEVSGPFAGDTSHGQGWDSTRSTARAIRAHPGTGAYVAARARPDSSSLTDGLVERERLVMDGIRAHLIDGLIFSPLASGRAELAARRDRTPMVPLGDRVYDGPVDHVAVDNVAAARTAVEHLIGLGRQRIAAIGEQHQPSGGTARLRSRGFTQALLAAGPIPDPAFIMATESYHRADGARAMAQLLERRPVPDAVFCYNDFLALGALRVLHERGMRVPQDVALVGFDDIEDGRYSTPSLTTVRPDKQRIAQLAVELLAGRLDGTDTGAPHELGAPFELTVRESTMGVPGPGPGPGQARRQNRRDPTSSRPRSAR